MILKTRIFLVALSLLSTLTAQTPFYLKGGVSVGTAYGPSETFQDSKFETFKPAFGFQAGIGREFRLSPGLGLMTELQFERRASREDADVSYLPPDSSDPGIRLRYQIRERSNLDYVSLPVLLSVGTKNLNLYAGPSVSYLLSANSRVKSEVTGTGVDVINGKQDVKVDLINDGEETLINRFNVALNAGLTFPLAPKVDLDFRVFHTVTDLTNNDQDRSFADFIKQERDISSRKDFDSAVGARFNIMFKL